MSEPARDDEPPKVTDTLPSADGGPSDGLATEEPPPTQGSASVSGEGRAGDFSVGDVVAERYEILGVLGRGVSGTVYRARDLYVDSGQEIVALKAIHAHLHGDRQIKGRFRREVKILRKLTGPHLCRLLEYIEEDDLLLIALEYVDGPSLDEYVAGQGGQLPMVEVTAIIKQICAALDKAHQTGIVHRDLKPSNVLIEGTRSLSSDGPPPSFLRELGVKVVDFGLAKVVAGDGTGTALTEQDMVFGTPDYMAPEQASGEELDGRCDIYAAGVILYELLVGKVPFDTPGPLTTMAAHLNDPVPMPSEQARGDRVISAELDAVVLKALSKSPDDRFASALELAAELERVMGLVEGGEGEPVSDDEARTDTLDEGDMDVADTHLDQEERLGTTLQSEKDAAIRAAKEKGAKVRVVVRDAEPASGRSSAAPSSALTADAGENRLWLAVALVAALVAVAAGIWLGGQ